MKPKILTARTSPRSPRVQRADDTEKEDLRALRLQYPRVSAHNPLNVGAIVNNLYENTSHTGRYCRAQMSLLVKAIRSYGFPTTPLDKLDAVTRKRYTELLQAFRGSHPKPLSRGSKSYKH